MYCTYMTVDLEEWYDLEYLKKYNLDQSVKVVPEIFEFLEILEEFHIKATFFVLANIVKDNIDVIEDIVKRGHAIACHGYDHQLLYEKTKEEYSREIRKAKEIIEAATGVQVKGYRAACFSMEREKLDEAIKSNYTYDSSFIRFEEHPLYRNLDLTGFKKVDDLVFQKENFFEYEVPTLNLGGKSIPISGGGYLRLFPYWMLNILIRIYAKKHKNFLIYLHPFELTNIRLPLNNIQRKDKFRINVGRKKNLIKIKKIIKLLKALGSEFRTIDKDVEKRGQ